MSFNKYFEELKRRNVLKASLAYIVASWIIIQVMSIILPTIEAPEYIMKLVLALLIIGFPIWVIFSWVYEITPDGIKKTANVPLEESVRGQTNNRLNKVIVGALVIAIGLLIYDVFAKPVNISNETIDNDKSIAVLAFADMSPQKDQEYFSDGISEEILNLLAKIQDLKVISRTSAFSFKGTNTTTEEIGKQLNVAHVLEGSVRKSGNTLRITTQLINTSTGAHLWSETYDRELDDIFEIQDEIADHVTEKLKTTILGEDLKSQKVDTEAYNLYLRAKSLYTQGESDKNEKAIELLKKAIEIDKNFTQAWVLLSGSYSRSISNYGVRPYSYFDSVFVMAKHAIKLDPNSSETLSNLAYSYLVKGDNDKAFENSKKALLINENDSKAANINGLLLRNSGDIDKAIPMFEKVAQLDPVRIGVFNYNLGSCYQMLNMIPEAEYYYNKIIKEKEFDAITFRQLAECAAYEGDKQKLVENLDKLIKGADNLLNLNAAGRLSNYFDDDELKHSYFEKVFNDEKFSFLDHADTAIGIGYKFIKSGKVEKGMELLNKTYETIEEEYGLESDYWEMPWFLANIEAIKGNSQKALDHLEQAVKAGCLMYQLFLKDPYFKDLKNEERFIEIIENLKSKIGVMRESIIKRNEKLNISFS